MQEVFLEYLFLNKKQMDTISKPKSVLLVFFPSEKTYLITLYFINQLKSIELP